MSEPDFERPVNQKEPDAYIEHLRQKAAEDAAEAERFLRPAIEAHLDTYQHGIDFLAFAHAQVIDRSDLDLAEATRSTAVWDIAGRAISLANALIDQLRRGYGPQTIGTTRLMFEAVSLLEALIEAPEIVVRKWLDGKHIPMSEARKHMVTLAVRSVEESAEAGEGVLDNPAYQTLAADIEATLEYEKFIQEKQEGTAPEGIAAIVEHIHREEYDELSHKRGGHNDRESLEFARDARLRQYVYGPHPDPRVQAGYVVNAGHDIQRVVIVAGFAFAKFFFGPSCPTHGRCERG
jgi:hypothetical protein